MARNARRRHQGDPMSRAMLRLVLRTNLVLLFLAGTAYVLWGERPGGAVFGSLLCAIAILGWWANALRSD